MQQGTICGMLNDPCPVLTHGTGQVRLGQVRLGAPVPCRVVVLPDQCEVHFSSSYFCRDHAPPGILPPTGLQQVNSSIELQTIERFFFVKGQDHRIQIHKTVRLQRMSIVLLQILVTCVTNQEIKFFFKGHSK